MARADIVTGTPFVLGTSLMYHSLHPTVVFVDETGMSKESDLFPLMCYYFPKAFGLFGDPKQLGPTVMSSKEENPFRGRNSNKESYLLPIITYYFPKAFGVFGDPNNLALR